MDIDLNLLGPYALQLQKAQAGKGKGTEAQPNTVRRANFTALYKKQNIKFIQDQDARRQGRQQKMEEHRRGRRSQIIAEGRKPTIAEMTNELNILIQEDSSNEISELDLGSGESSSASLSKKDVSNNNNKSDGISEIKNSVNIVGHDTGIEQKNNASVSNSQTKVNVNKNSSKQDQNKKPATQQAVKDSRRDQLQKWKKEKEAADLKAKHVQRQPFKVGAPVVTKPVKGVSAASTVKSANSTTNASTAHLGSTKSTTISSRPATGITSATNIKQPIVGPRMNAQPVNVSKPKPTTRPGTAPPPVTKSEEARRVTRAMSKAQTNTTATSVGNKVTKTANGLGISKPPIQKMKALNINERPAVLKPGVAPGKAAVTVAKSVKPFASKTAATATTTPPTAVTSGLNKKGVSTQVTLKGKEKKPEESVDTNPIKEPILAEQKPAPVPQEVVKKKKAKPKAIDATYTDYNGRFSDACRKLSEISTGWRAVLEEQNEIIPEDTRDELYSALGKVKLLLESKLPQFGELLYAYLCKDEDATIILACDLEGWWDVAFIQVEAVYKIFDSLTTLKNNNWSTPQSLPSQEPKAKHSGSLVEDAANLKSDKESVNPLQRRLTKPKAQPSTGLKAFLANKRKGLGGNSDNDTSNRTTNQDSAQTANFSLPSASSSEPTSIDPVVSTNVLHVPSKINVAHQNQENCLNQDDELANRKFEGGFFNIRSPITTPTTPRERRREDFPIHLSTGDPNIIPASAVPLILRTPNRHPRLSSASSTSDASLRRASLTMLGVRNSMGSFSRIGAAVSVFAENVNQEQDTE